MAHIDYPVDFPIDCASTLIDTIRKGTVRENTAEFAHCLWNVQGFLQGHFIGRPAAMFGAGTVVPSPRTLERIDEIEASLTTFLEDQKQYTTASTDEEGTKKGKKKKDEAETFGADNPAGIDPVTIAVIIQAAMQIMELIKLWRNRK